MAENEEERTEEERALEQIEALERRRAEREGKPPPDPDEVLLKRRARREAIKQMLQAERREEPPERRRFNKGELFEMLERAGRAASEEAALRELPRALDERHQGLSPEDRAVVAEAIAWLEEKWGDIGCPYCSNQDWSVGPPVQFLVEGRASIPLFPVACTNCGHTTFIDAIHAGVWPDRDGGSKG